MIFLFFFGCFNTNFYIDAETLIICSRYFGLSRNVGRFQSAHSWNVPRVLANAFSAAFIHPSDRTGYKERQTRSPAITHLILARPTGSPSCLLVAITTDQTGPHCRQTSSSSMISFGICSCASKTYRQLSIASKRLLYAIDFSRFSRSSTDSLKLGRRISAESDATGREYETISRSFSLQTAHFFQWKHTPGFSNRISAGPHVVGTWLHRVQINR